MARGTTFSEMIEMLKLKVGLDPDPALSLNLRPRLELLIKEEYERLYQEFDWPFLRIFPDMLTQAGERFYDVPDNMDLERIETVDYYWGNRWFPLERGISQIDYNTYNPDLDVRVDPTFKWDIKFTDPKAQVELWPIPASNDNKVRFTGIRKKTELVDTTSRCDLDDQMIVLFAASEYLAGRGSKDAGIIQQKAVERKRLMCGRSITTRNNAFNMNNQQKPDPRFASRSPLVAYVRNP
jgi:hypothetical protein